MNIVGVDVGGTSIRATLFRDGVDVRTVVRRAALDTGEAPVPAMVALIRQVADGQALEGVGMAITGPVDVATRIVDNPHTLPDWSGSDWVAEVESALGVPVVVDNDAMGAAIGEFAFGAGREADVMAMITLGTGIGVAVISRSAGPLRGTGGFHPEGGHVLIAGGESGEQCYCGQIGCWEQLCSGSSIPARWTTDGMIRWDEYGRMLARGVRTLSRAFAPDTIVFGGGVSANFDDFIPAVREAFAAPDPMAPPVVLRQAELEQPGTAGAAHLAALRVGRNRA